MNPMVRAMIKNTENALKSSDRLSSLHNVNTRLGNLFGIHNKLKVDVTANAGGPW